MSPMIGDFISSGLLYESEVKPFQEFLQEKQNRGFQGVVSSLIPEFRRSRGIASSKGANGTWEQLLENAKNGREYYMNESNRSYIEELRERWRRGDRLNDRERDILYTFGDPEGYGGVVTSRTKIN